MNICQDHWDRLREKMKERGLENIGAMSPEVAVVQLIDQVEKDEVTKTNFDPLMSAYFAIGANAMETISWAGGNPLYLITAGEEEPCELPGGEGRTWPKCSLCYLNMAHELTCSGCDLPKINGFDYMLDRAADDSLAKAKELGLVG